MDEIEMVKAFLRGQNLEQLGRTDEAIELYETTISSGFDAVGPYDRLIVLHGQQARHAEVVRVCDLALKHVRTYDEKRTWYENIRSKALEAGTRLPRPAPKRL